MTQRRPIAITRRKLLLAGAAVPLCAILTRPAAAAEFTYKLATGQDPTHPVNVRAKEATDRIREATSGRLEINLFPANQLGSDTDLLTQVRNGSVEFFNLSSLILATLVPATGMVNLGDTRRVQRWRALFREGVESGDLRTDLDAAAATLLVLSAANWAYTWLEPGRDTDELADRFTAILVDGIRGYASLR